MELLEEIFRRGVSDMQTSLADSEEANSPASSGIERHIRQTVKLLKEKKDFWRLLHSIRLQSPVVQQLMADRNGQSSSTESQIRQNLIEAGIPFPDLEAKLLFASLDGMAQHFLLIESYPIDDVATLLIMKYKK
ncbi:TetR/AcrR family transcriptional regulator [Pontibacter sp. HJ8]